MSRALAWMAYLPVPGAALVPVLAEPADRHTRFHAWQGTVFVLMGYLALVLVGFAARGPGVVWFEATVGAVAALLLVAFLVGIGCGITSAARGRYGRVRPAWDLLVLLRR